MRNYSRDVLLLLAFFGLVLLVAAWWSGRLDGLLREIDRIIG